MKVHQFVQAYVRHERTLPQLIVDFSHLKDPRIEALGRIAGALGDPAKMPGCLASLDKVPLTDADSSLVILFYHFWINLAQSHGHLMEAAALLRRQKSLLTVETPPDLAAIAALSEVALIISDPTRAEKMERELCERKGLTPGLHLRLLVNCLAFLANEGRIRDAQKFADEMNAVKLDSETHLRWLLTRCANHLENGRIKEASVDFEQSSARMTVGGPYDDWFKNNKELLGLLRRQWAHGPIQVPSDAAESLVSGWAWSTRALQEQQLDLALSWSKRFIQRNLSVMNNGLATYTLIRAHLAARNHEAARQWLHLREQRRIRHWLDDFFRARVEWLSNQPEQAAGYLARAMKAAEFYQAEGRLDFEFSLAIDMSPSDVARLCRLASSRGAAVPPPPSARSSARLIAIADPGQLVGESTATKNARALIRKYAPLPAPILITGETGTGKEMIARALHEASPRRKLPLIAINCGAIAETLLESELFGHARGAFTGAEREHKGVFVEAGSGTLFLDEIGEISPRLQVVLLRVLETGEVRPIGGSRAQKTQCRIIFATNADLEARVQAGTFRQDLLYRLRRLNIHLAPLREHPEDIVPLAKHFLRLNRVGGALARLTPDLENLLQRRPWPGNVRELRNEVERMVWLNPGQNEYGVAEFSEADAGALTTAKSAALESSHSGKTAAEKTGSAAAALAGEEWQSKSAFRRAERLKELFQQHRRLSRLETARLLNISLNTAALDLRRLADENYIEMIRPSASSRSHYYVLKAPQQAD